VAQSVYRLGYWLDDRGSGPDTKASRPVLWSTQPLTQGVKQPRSETGHSPPSNADVKNMWSYTPKGQSFPYN